MEKLRSNIYYWLEDEDNPRLWITSLILSIVVIASVVLILIEETILHPSKHLISLNNAFVILFAIEYLSRLSVVDIGYKKENPNEKLTLKEHIMVRVKWMLSPLALIDLISLLPYVRVFRLLRVLRAFKLFRYFNSIAIFFRGIKSGWMLYILLSVITMMIIGFGSLGIFLAEHSESSTEYDNYYHTFRHVLGIFNLIEDSPQTVIGKLLSTGILLYNMVFFGFIVSFINQKMGQTMDEIKRGHIGKISLKNHICVLGYTQQTKYFISDLLKHRKYRNKIVILTEKEDIDHNGVITVQGDYTEKKWIEYINVKEASTIVITSEDSGDLDEKDQDLRSILTLYKINTIISREYIDSKGKSTINKTRPYIIIEINDEQNIGLINKTGSKSIEVISKDLIDSQMLRNSIKHKGASKIFKKLIGINELSSELKVNKLGPRVQFKNLIELIPDKKRINSIATLEDLRKELIELDYNLLGVYKNVENSDDESQNQSTELNEIITTPQNRTPLKDWAKDGNLAKEIKVIVYGK